MISGCRDFAPPIPSFSSANTCFNTLQLGLSNLAATIVNLLGYEAPEVGERGILEIDAGAAARATR